MTNIFSKTKFFTLLGIIFASYVCYALVMMNDRGSAWWTFFYGILYSVVLICGWGLWHSERWALRLSWVLALAGLGLGGYLAHFAWTFWIFREPSFFDRVFAVMHPRILIFTLFPAGWLFYFTRREFRV